MKTDIPAVRVTLMGRYCHVMKPEAWSKLGYPDCHGLQRSQWPCPGITLAHIRHPFPSNNFVNGLELACGTFFFFFVFVFFPRLLRPSASVADAERYMPVTSFTRSGSLCLIGVADFAKELLAYLGMYAARRGFLPTLTNVEAAPHSSSLSGLLLVMQP